MANPFASLSESLADLVEKAGASIVRVEARRRLPASGIVWSAEGVLLTASHVVEREEEIHVGLPDGKHVAAEFVGRDPAGDLAVLRVPASGLQPFQPAALEKLRAGALGVALARPGERIQAALGMLSAVGEGRRMPGGARLEPYLRADVTMYPGFSGGPLIGADGALIGLNTSALLRDAALTIPHTALARTAEALLAHGRIRRGYLGVASQPVRLPAGLAAELGQETGLLIVAVEPDSPAERGGLLLGDTLVAAGGSPVRHPDDLAAALGTESVGQPLAVRVVRGGALHELQVTPGERG